MGTEIIKFDPGEDDEISQNVQGIMLATWMYIGCTQPEPALSAGVVDGQCHSVVGAAKRPTCPKRRLPICLLSPGHFFR